MKEKVRLLLVRFPSYVDDLHYGLYKCGRVDPEVGCEEMADMIESVKRTVKEMITSFH